MRKEQKRRGRPKAAGEKSQYIQALVRILESLDFSEARQAARVLGETTNPAAVRPLVAAVRAAGGLRAEAIAALKKISRENDAAAADLTILLMEEKHLVDTGIVAGDRRRSPRVLLEIPVVVRWQGADGEWHEEPSTTRLVNAYGALLSLRRPLPFDTRIELTNAITSVSTTACVVWCGAPTSGGEHEIGVELADPDPDFWVGRP